MNSVEKAFEAVSVPVFCLNHLSDDCSTVVIEEAPDKVISVTESVQRYMRTRGETQKVKKSQFHTFCYWYMHTEKRT